MSPNDDPATVARLSRIVESMKLVVADCETDAQALDGQPFDGRTAGENFGNVYAMIQAVARAVGVLAENQR